MTIDLDRRGETTETPPRLTGSFELRTELVTSVEIPVQDIAPLPPKAGEAQPVQSQIEAEDSITEEEPLDSREKNVLLVPDGPFVWVNKRQELKEKLPQAA